ncbi:MAG: hypothetical protein R3E61_11710 [Pseudomonadales bacterium]
MLVFIEGCVGFFLCADIYCPANFYLFADIYWRGFFFYTMQMAGSHGFNWRRIDVFLLDNSLYSIPILILLAVVFISHGGGWAWSWLFLGFASMSAISRMYSGGAYNVLMPYYMLASLVAALGFWCLAVRAEARRCAAFLVCVSILAAMNFAYGWYKPSAQIPSDKARAFGDQLVMKIAAVSGRVCLTKDGYLSYLAGKDFCAHNAFMADVMNGGVIIYRRY